MMEEGGPKAGADILAEIRRNLKLKIMEVLLELRQVSPNDIDIETEADTEEARIFAQNSNKTDYFVAMLKHMYMLKKHTDNLTSEHSQNAPGEEYTHTHSQSAIHGDSPVTPPLAQEFSSHPLHHAMLQQLQQNSEDDSPQHEPYEQLPASSSQTHTIQNLSQSQPISRSVFHTLSQPLPPSLSQSADQIQQQSILHTIQMQHLSLQQALHNTSAQNSPYNSQLPYLLQYHPELLQMLHTQAVSPFQMLPHTPSHSQHPLQQTLSTLTFTSTIHPSPHPSPRPSSPTHLHPSQFPPQNQQPDGHPSQIMWSQASQHTSVPLYSSHRQLHVQTQLHTPTSSHSPFHIGQPPSHLQQSPHPSPSTHLMHGQSTPSRSHLNDSPVSHLGHPHTPPPQHAHPHAQSPRPHLQQESNLQHGSQPSTPPNAHLQQGQSQAPHLHGHTPPTTPPLSTHIPHGQPQPQLLQPQRAHEHSQLQHQQQQLQVQMQNYYYHEQDPP